MKNEMASAITSLFANEAFRLLGVAVIAFVCWKFFEGKVSLYVERSKGRRMFKDSAYERNIVIQHDTSQGANRATIRDVDEDAVWLDYGGGVCKPIPMESIPTVMLGWSIVHHVEREYEEEEFEE